MDIVLGAGMAGLGAFYADNELEIYEKMSKPGGLCSGFEINGFYFDQAVHLSFTNNQLVRSAFGNKYIKHLPESVSWFRERWLRHPAQNNLFPCTVEDKIKAITSFSEREELEDIDNFESWAKSQYGNWLYDNLFKPYNEKYWCIDLKMLGTKWIGNRIYRPTLDEILYGSYTSDTPNTYYAKEMRYPKDGGYVSFLNDVVINAEQKKKIHYEKRVRKIDTCTKEIYFEDAGSVSYEKLYSSMPILEMINVIDHVPDNIKRKKGELEYTSIALVSIGFNRRIDFDRIWFYIYDSDIFAARAHLPSLKSEANVPEGKSSIQFEIYFNSKNKKPEREECVSNCRYALKKMNIASLDDIEFEDFRIVPYGNVIFKKNTEDIVEEVRLFLNSKGIIPIGRFGRWEYLWSDQAFLSGYSAVKESR